MKNFIQPGEVIEIVAGVGGIVSGDGVAIGDLFGIAATTAAQGEQCRVALTGVFELPKGAGALNQGVRVYWDNAANQITATAAGNIFAGYVFEAASGGATLVRTLLARAGNIAAV